MVSFDIVLHADAMSKAGGIENKGHVPASRRVAIISIFTRLHLAATAQSPASSLSLSDEKA